MRKPHTCPSCNGRKVTRGGEGCPTCSRTGVVWEPDEQPAEAAVQDPGKLDLTYEPDAA